MKLHWSPRSPFVRKVMIAASEVGVEAEIGRMRNVVQQPDLNPVVMADNPLNKIPTMILDDGMALIDSRVICEYLDGLHEGPKLFPEGAERWRALRWQALADGILEQQVLLRNERNRVPGEQSPAFIRCYRDKVIAGLDRLEKESEEIATAPYAIGHIAIGCLLAYTDFRFDELTWRVTRPGLAQWYDRFAVRPAVLAHPIS